MDEKQPLWEKIALLMECRGIKTVAKLAELAEIPATTIYTWKQDYENAKNHNKECFATPNVYNLQKVAKALNVEIADLL